MHERTKRKMKHANRFYKGGNLTRGIVQEGIFQSRSRSQKKGFTGKLTRVPRAQIRT